MATEIQINAVVDAIVSAFGGNVALFTAWLTRSKLETEYAQIESAIRQAQATEAAQNAQYISDLGDLQAQLEAKQAEIDAL